MNKYQIDYDRTSAKARFVTDIIDEKLVLYTRTNGRRVHKKREEVDQQLAQSGYPKFSNSDDDSKDNYNYLLHMRIESFTEETIKKLENECKILFDKLEKLRATSPMDLWNDDLDDFLKDYHEEMKTWLSINESDLDSSTSSSKPKKIVKKKVAKSATRPASATVSKKNLKK